MSLEILFFISLIHPAKFPSFHVLRDQTNSYPWQLFPLCTMCSSSVKSLTQSFHDLCKFVDAWRCIFEQNWWFLLTSVLSRYPVVQPQNLHTTSIASSGVPCCKHDCLVAFQHNLQNICLSLPSTRDVLQHILLLLLPAIPNTWHFQPPKNEVHVTTGFYYGFLLHIELPPFTAFDKKNLPKDAWHWTLPLLVTSEMVLKPHSQHLCKQQPKPKFTRVMFSNWNLQKPMLMFTTPPKCFKLLRLHSNLLNLPKTWSTWVLSSKNLWWHGWRNSCPTLWSQLLGAQHLMSLVLPPPAQSHPSTILLWEYHT